MPGRVSAASDSAPSTPRDKRKVVSDVDKENDSDMDAFQSPYRASTPKRQCTMRPPTPIFVPPSPAPKRIKKKSKKIQQKLAKIKKTKSSKKSTIAKKATKKVKKHKPIEEKKLLSFFDPIYVNKLAKAFPDTYWSELKQNRCIRSIKRKESLKLLPVNITDKSPILGLQISEDGEMLASFNTFGYVNIFDTEDYSMIQHLRDDDELNIDEFYTGEFLNNGRLLAVGGKLKDRKRWSLEDDDNHILPCPIKIFDLVTGKVIVRLIGHEEEILCIKAVQFNGDNYIISTSQDGWIYRWHMSSDWSALIASQRVKDGISCMVFTVSFVPSTGNKYFLAAADEHLRLFDLETCEMIQTFPDIYSSYCDCVKFIQSEDMNKLYLLTRGVELLDMEGNTVSSRPNSCILHELVMPTAKNGEFQLKQVKQFNHPEYLANSWLMKITSNSTYVAAPTIQGKVLLFDLKTGEVILTLADHEEVEVRDIKFHPFKKQLLTCSDDGTIKVYELDE